MLRGNSDFRWYFLGSVTSDFGTWLQNSAQVLLAYQLAHSVLTVGFVTFAQFTSPLVLGPWAGVAADKFGGRRTLLGHPARLGRRAATLAGLDFAGLLNAWVPCRGAIISGLTFTSPCRATSPSSGSSEPTSSSPPLPWTPVSYNLGRALAPVLTIGMGLTESASHGPSRQTPYRSSPSA